MIIGLVGEAGVGGVDAPDFLQGIQHNSTVDQQKFTKRNRILTSVGVRSSGIISRLATISVAEREAGFCPYNCSSVTNTR